MKVKKIQVDRKLIKLIDHILSELIEMKLNLEYLLEKANAKDD
tara:strand:- start:529 stop:657 length:129 start_codon:yes stop_codon:yes gene_type:complete